MYHSGLEELREAGDTNPYESFRRFVNMNASASTTRDRDIPLPQYHEGKHDIIEEDNEDDEEGGGPSKEVRYSYEDDLSDIEGDKYETGSEDESDMMMRMTR